MVVVGEPGVVMVALGPLTLLQVPVPVLGLLAAMVTEVVVEQMVWSGPALEVVGGVQASVHVYVSPWLQSRVPKPPLKRHSEEFDVPAELLSQSLPPELVTRRLFTFVAKELFGPR